MSMESSTTCSSNSEAPKWNSPRESSFKDAADFQLVPYQPSPILSEFHQVKRSFEFAGKVWTVHQQWNDVGLASVVWEAVSYLSLLTGALSVTKQAL